MRLPDRLFTAVQRYENCRAVCAGRESVSYGELWRRSDALAANLIQRGVNRGRRVAILAAASINAVVAFWSIVKAGGVAVFLNEQQTPDSLMFVIEDCGASFILAEEKFLDTTLGENVRRACSGRLIDIDQAGATEAAALPGEGGFCSHDPAVIVYTSGSAGVPKGVCLSHRNLEMAVLADIQYFSITAADSYLMLVPLHYVHGLTQLLIHLLSGAAVHFAGGFSFPLAVTRKLRDLGVSGVSGVPYHINALIERGKFLETALPSLRWIGVTGGPLPVCRIQQLRRVKPALAVCITYGQTESSPRITALAPEKIDLKPTSVGAPPTGIQVEVVDGNGRTVPVGEEGEVVVAGDNIMLGYWRDPDATRRVIDNKGRLLTGDLGRFDQDGDLFLLGRKRAMIKSAGERIIPAEIERVLTGHVLIEDAVVVGVPDELYGERVEAHIVVSENARPDDDPEELLRKIREYCLEYIPFFRAPKKYHRWDSFPLRANGKVDRRALIGR